MAAPWEKYQQQPTGPWSNFKGDEKTTPVDWKALLEQEAAREQDEYIANLPTWKKVALNVGAGVDQLVTGAKQLFSGEEEEKRLRKEVDRKRPFNKKLGESLQVGLDSPSWVPTAGEALQSVGQIAPTMAIPVGWAGQGMRMLPNAYRAVRGLPAATAPARIGTGSLVADAAASGAAFGAIAPVGTEDSRGINMLTGAATGAAFPLTMAGGNQVANMVTRSGGERRAGAQIGRELAGDGVDEGAVLNQTLARLRAIQQARANQIPGAPGQNIPLSTAAQLRDAQLARLEAGSRARNGANWYDFDQQQAAAVADALRTATSSADDLAARKALRGQNWDTRWAQAKGSANMQNFGQNLAGFRKNLDQAMMSAESSNPAVRNMLTSIADEVDRLGPAFGLGNLQQIRANLSGKYNPMSPNAYASVPRDAPATQSVLREIDNILNQATNNRWQDVVTGYARESQPVAASKAAGRVREAFYDPATGRVRGVAADAAGDVPKITEAGLGRALDAARGPDKSLQLSPEANRRVEAILDALRAQNIVQGVKRSATAGGGSNTASDMFAARAAAQAGDTVAGMAGGPAGVATKTALDALGNVANANRDAALARALQNPEQMIAIIERRLQAGQPLSATEDAFLRVVRGVSATPLTGN
jgi:hypothetical protein